MLDSKPAVTWEVAARKLEEARDRSRRLWETVNRPAVLHYVAGNESPEERHEVQRLSREHPDAATAIAKARLAMLGPPVTVSVRRSAGQVALETPIPSAKVEPIPADMALGEGEQVIYSLPLDGCRLMVRLFSNAKEWVVMVRFATADGEGSAERVPVELVPADGIVKATGNGKEVDFMVENGEYVLRTGRALTRLVLRSQE